MLCLIELNNNQLLNLLYFVMQTLRIKPRIWRLYVTHVDLSQVETIMQKHCAKFSPFILVLISYIFYHKATCASSLAT